MRFVSFILTLLFLFTGTGAAGYVHEAQHSQRRENLESAQGQSIWSAAVEGHDESRCAVCLGIASSHTALQTSAIVAVGSHSLIARCLPIGGDVPATAAPSRRSCRDPPAF